MNPSASSPPLAHFATLCKYGGISFIAGAVNHGFFSGERSLITAVIGVLAYLVGGILERRANPGSNQSWADMLGVGIVAAVGLGFFTGGLQHFPDSPERSAWVVPLGFVMSFAAYWWTQGRAQGSHRAMSLYGLGMTAAVVLACVVAWKLIGHGSAGDHDHEHGAHSHAGDAVQTPSASTQTASSQPVRELRIEMDDTMRFSPSTLDVTAGVPVRLVVVNRGRLRHELVLGSAAELDAHAKQMREAPAAHHHTDRAIQVEPGATRSMDLVFKSGDELGMACFEPGHFEAGMRGTVKVMPQS